MEESMNDPTMWWIAVGTAVAFELLTGSFYLLMLAIGLSAAAVAAHAGAPLPVQLVVAALVGAGAVVAWHLKRGRSRNMPAPGANRDVNMDVGESVHIDSWHADGTATVKYRGANWTAILAPGVTPDTGAHLVREITGNRLVVEKV
jgi:membrane protein implicated in regulation of membrane protease activity